MTAAEKCDSSKITDLNSTKIAECKAETNNYVSLFDVRFIYFKNLDLTISNITGVYQDGNMRLLQGTSDF